MKKSVFLFLLLSFSVLLFAQADKNNSHFLITGKPGPKQISINAGERISVFPGASIRVYKANTDTSGAQPTAEGVIRSVSRYYSVAELNSTLNETAEKYWVYIIQNGKMQVPRIEFNTSYSGNKKTTPLFDEILIKLKASEELRTIIEFVDNAGDLKISTITNNNNLSLTIINPNTNTLIKELTLPGGISDIEPLIKQIREIAKYEYLSRLRNEINEIALDFRLHYFAKGKEIKIENGCDVYYESDTVYMELVNNNDHRVYFSLIDLQPDKVVNVIFPNLSAQIQPEDLFVPAHSTLSLKQYALTLTPPYGFEKFKLFTSREPIDMTPLSTNAENRTRSTANQDLFKAINKNTASPVLNEVNVQNYDFEIRSNVFKSAPGKTSGEMFSAKFISSSIPGSIDYLLQNYAAIRIYYNVLKRNDDGSYSVIAPAKSESENTSFISPGLNQTFNVAGLKEYDQLITVYADRPFLISDMVTADKTLNNLLAELIRNHSLSTSLNKIGMIQSFYLPENKTASRGSEKVLLQLLNPKVTNDRGGITQAVDPEIEICGVAVSADNKLIRTIRINGTVANYDNVFHSFQKNIPLSNGVNKVVIEATDEDGFTATKVVNFELKNNKVAEARPGKNFFLGIGIDNYKFWPPLVNAKFDVIEFADLLHEKFDYSASLLLDSEANKSNIIDSIYEFMKKVGPNDNVIIYMSGHGNEDIAAEGDYYFIAQETELTKFYKTGVKSTDIMDYFLKIKAKKCLLIMDACYAGMITNNISGNTTILTSTNDQGNSDDLPCKWVLASGGATKVADGIKGEHSPFSKALLTYLKEHNDDKSLSMPLLINYLREELKAKNEQQKPVGKALRGEGDRIFKTKTTGK